MVYPSLSGAGKAQLPQLFSNEAYWYSDISTTFISFESTLIVPSLPDPAWAGNTIFIWPGLQPLNKSANYEPIETGVLQPVLGCYGGPILRVVAGDALSLEMKLTNSTVWLQTVANPRTGESVEYAIDLQGQAQTWAIFDMEIYGTWKPEIAPQVQLVNLTLKTADPSPSLGKNTHMYSAALSGGSVKCDAPVVNEDQTQLSVGACYFNRPGDAVTGSPNIVTGSPGTTIPISSDAVRASTSWLRSRVILLGLFAFCICSM
ncbi:hypothetical protein HDU91_005351 [Kappamyces sp. JEL0680]|nr:hypothetical protein HDU91_005351 [Kappamyces sp. JEL0680]